MGTTNHHNEGVNLASAELAVPQRPLPALAMSLIFHVVLLTVIGWLWSSSPSGTAQPEDRQVGIAMVHRMPDRDRYVDAAEASSEQAQVEAAEPAAAAAAATAPPADVAPPVDLSGVLEAMKATPSASTSSGLAGETSLPGDAFGEGPGKRAQAGDSETTAVLFGVSGSGSRFVYVMDRSDSMNGFGGAPLRAAKAELIRSLRSLSKRQRFQIIFYNDQPEPYRSGNQSLAMIPGESPRVEQAVQHVQSRVAIGGTEHHTALKLALRMAPDVIFFLTDARIPRLSQSELAEIRRRAQRSGTTIHAIEFGPEPSAPATSFLRELAAQNNGQYQYIDVGSLLTAPESQP